MAEFVDLGGGGVSGIGVKGVKWGLNGGTNIIVRDIDLLNHLVGWGGFVFGGEG